MLLWALIQQIIFKDGDASVHATANIKTLLPTHFPIADVHLLPRQRHWSSSWCWFVVSVLHFGFVCLFF